MYTILFLLISVCVLAVVRDWPGRTRLLLWAGTLSVTLLAFLPHLDRAFDLSF
ncbi:MULTISPECIES: hypothetical protein [unclassified Streptomyces]|uniref:hypothetical protein n=1 Tax=unclassified Streptomyces TaxID=2593676 RepID=UPI00202ECCE0|nr:MULTISPECIES: hypothetical protein [unclassified Streptomyces]MCM1970512.1 hypothetical protein [Streptomyces sp. G1]MCX5127544.1 hypothetical protein [Streptomyces sp. NBC_00347]MCX5295036.1 hypothetical protein [Streptomyces sp. NBC_00193]